MSQVSLGCQIRLGRLRRAERYQRAIGYRPRRGCCLPIARFCWGDDVMPRELASALVYRENRRLDRRGGRACRVCGCTDQRACPGGCWWVEWDLCSACARKAVAT